MTRLSISGLPRAAACPGSFALPQASVQSQFADDGHARHSIAESAILDQQHDKLPEEIRALIPAGALVKTELEVAYDWHADTGRILHAGEREIGLGPTEIAGRIDLVILADRMTVLDWKGYESVGEPDQNPQLMTYTLAAARIFEVQEARLVVAYVAEEEGALVLNRPLVIRDVDGPDLELHRQRLIRILRSIDEQKARVASGLLPDVRESRACRWCDAIASCPAKTALIKRLANADITGLELVKPLDPAQAGHAYEQILLMEAVLKRIKSQVFAIASYQDVPLSNGRVLRKVIKDGNERLDADKAHAVLTEMFGAYVADQAMKRSTFKNAIERALKAGGVRPVAPAMKAALAEIKKRGGISSEQRTEFDEVPVQPQLRAVNE